MAVFSKNDSSHLILRPFSKIGSRSEHETNRHSEVSPSIRGLSWIISRLLFGSTAPVIPGGRRRPSCTGPSTLVGTLRMKPYAGKSSSAKYTYHPSWRVKRREMMRLESLFSASKILASSLSSQSCSISSVCWLLNSLLLLMISTETNCFIPSWSRFTLTSTVVRFEPATDVSIKFVTTCLKMTLLPKICSGMSSERTGLFNVIDLFFNSLSRMLVTWPRVSFTEK